ncbi:MAG: hypothetical protein NT154_12915 [Verrucomicrobia bacterium]|nr:hypothetical protein [Verrucomicrobiota bacterium]
MAKGEKMGIGQFLSMTPEMRRDTAMMDTRFNPQMMDLQREQRRQRQPGLTEFEQSQRAVMKAIMDTVKGLDALVAAAKPKAATMNVTATNVAVTGTTIVINGPVAQSPKATTGTTAGAAPRLPAAGGTGAGAGHQPPATQVPNAHKGTTVRDYSTK